MHVIIAGSVDAIDGTPVFIGAACVEVMNNTIIKVEPCESPEHASAMAVGMAMAYNADMLIDRFEGTTKRRAQLQAVWN